MKTQIWTVDFDLGHRHSRIYVSASTVILAIKNAVWGYNKSTGENINSKRIVKVRQGWIE